MTSRPRSWRATPTINNVEKRYSITFTYNDTAYILSEQGDVDGALEFYRKTYAIRKALAEADPENVRLRAGIAYCLQSIGQNLVFKGQFDEALKAYGESLAAYESLAQLEENKSGLTEVAAMQARIGDTHMRAAAQARSAAVRRDRCGQSLDWSRRALQTLKLKGDADQVSESSTSADEIRKTMGACERLLGG